MTAVLLVTPVPTINPGADAWSTVQPGAAPRDLATIAALTPAEHRLEIWDETVRGELGSRTNPARRYDIVAVGARAGDCDRAIEIGRWLRDAGVRSAVAGAGVSSQPERYRDAFDVLLIGDVEDTWPQFLADFAAGRDRREYHQASPVSLEDSPVPRWGLIRSDVDRYAWFPVETTRRAPQRAMHGASTTPQDGAHRHRPVDRVAAEVATLRHVGAVTILLDGLDVCQDADYARPLLRALAALNRSFRRPVRFRVETSAEVARDDEMLQLLADANVTSLVVPIVSPTGERVPGPMPVAEAGMALLQHLKKIQSHGLGIEGRCELDLDEDDLTIFERQFLAVQLAGLTAISIRPPMVPPGTPRWDRLRRDHRMVDQRAVVRMGHTAGLMCNVVPARMSMEQLLRGCRTLVTRLHEWSAFQARVHRMAKNTERCPPLMPRFTTLSWRKLWRIARAVVMSAGVRRDLWQQVTAMDRSTHHKRALVALLILFGARRHARGNAPRDRYVRSVTLEMLGVEWRFVHRELPGLLRRIDEDLAFLARRGQVPIDRPVPEVPETAARS